MDSKLIGSNVVRCSRLGLIVSCIQAFWKSLSDCLRFKLNEEQSVAHSLPKTVRSEKQFLERTHP
jgi:hypothetical protein